MNKPIFLTLLSILGVSGAALAAPSKAPAWHWYYYTLDKSPNADGYKGFSRIRYDKQGDLKVMYRRGGNLIYGVFDGKTFGIQVADTAMYTPSQIAMTLDSKGNPHVIHHDWTYRYLMYAHYDGKEWTRFLADSLKHTGSDFYQVALEADSADNLHMLYTVNLFNNGLGSLAYASYDKDHKRTERMNFPQAVGTGGKWSSIAFDGDGMPAAAYYIYEKNSMMLARKRDTGWAYEVVMKKPDVPQEPYYSSIQITPDGTFKIVAQSRTDKQVQMVVRGPADTAWSSERVDTLIEYSTFTTPSQLRIGKDGTHFVLAPKASMNGSEPEDCKLWLSYKTDSTWESQPVDTTGFVGLYADMTLTPEGLPAISYYDAEKNELRLAVAKSAAPSDSNGNGIPDYRETQVQVTGILKTARAALPEGSYRLYDALGRRVAAPRILACPEGAGPCSMQPVPGAARGSVLFGTVPEKGARYRVILPE